MMDFAQRYGFYLFLLLVSLGSMVYGFVDEQVEDKEILALVGVCVTTAAAAYRGNRPDDVS